MPNPKARTAALLASPEDVEAQFYEALREGDLERLMAVWADDDEIVCVHPGGGRVIGPQAVRAVFESIFGNGAIQVHPEHVHRLNTLGSAVHSVVERIDLVTPEGPRSGWILATNVYIKTDRGWRLAAHHTSPGSMDAVPETPTDTPTVLH